MTLDIIIPTTGTHPDFDRCVQSWGRDVLLVGDEEVQGVLPKMQWAYEHTDGDILLYVHNDVEVKEEGWYERLLNAFSDESVAIAGFGGASILGRGNLYKRPYIITDLARDGYASNVDDAETHGERFTGERDVAVLDGYVLAVRRSLLDKLGGWPVDRYPSHHVYDLWICAAAHRAGYRVRLVGVRCHHLGGRTATTAEYQQWATTTPWGSDVGMHAAGHRIFYEEFRGILPIRVHR